MPRNPERAARGGDVEGMDRTDVDGAVGSPLEVSAASFDPGYPLEETLEAGYATEADLKKGFCSYGVSVGESMPKGIIGGKR